MGYIKKEAAKYIKDNGGLSLAQGRAEQWFRDAFATLGDTGVLSYTGPFLPGKIYVFEYLRPRTADKLKWWDLNPVVLSLGRKNGLDIGINLNLLPYQIKMRVLDDIYEQFKQFISEEQRLYPNDVRRQKHILGVMYDNMVRLLIELGFKYAIRTYHTALRENTAVISYENWYKIAVIDFFVSVDNRDHVPITKAQVVRDYYRYIIKRGKR